ncbi:MAG: hypothetical protein H7145_17765 [Akkermansiaceae bacterium]|nr:hypothetical protein [Armatimonadota bacterium]
MNNTPDLLNIRLHLVTGEVASFLAEDASAVQTVLDSVRRGRVFSTQSLVIADSIHVNAFPGSALIRVDLFSNPLPLDMEGHSVGEGEPAHSTEITQEEWLSETAAMRERYPDRHAMMSDEGGRINVYGRTTLMGGDHIYLQFDVPTPNVSEQRRFLHNLYSQPSLAFRNNEGGISVLNTAHVIRSTFYPGAEPPLGAWYLRERQAL